MPAASEKIKEFYVELRGKSKDTGSVAITPRYLEGLVSLAEANAKTKLNETVEPEDAEVAISLFNYVMQQIMTDKTTGAFDIDASPQARPRPSGTRCRRPTPYST